MLLIWTDWANPQELGSLGIASSDSKYLMILWGVSPAVWWWWLSRQVMSDSFATPWAAARQAPLSMGFPRQEQWRGLPFPSPGELPDPGIEPESPALAGGLFTAAPPGKALQLYRSSQVVQKEAEKGLQQWFPMTVMLPIKEECQKFVGAFFNCLSDCGVHYLHLMGKGQGFEMFCNKQNPMKDCPVSHRTFKSTTRHFHRWKHVQNYLSPEPNSVL